MDEQNRTQEYIDRYDLAGYLSEISDRILLRSEMLRGINNLLGEYDSEEGKQIFTQLGVELGHISRQLSLIGDQLCHNCQLKVVTDVLSIQSENSPVKEEKAGGK